MGMAVLLSEKTNTVQRLHVALELSAATWRVALSNGNGVRQVQVKAGDLKELASHVEKAKRRFGLPSEAETLSCYEAGRDGFWLHRWLESVGILNVVVEPASILVDRRARRAKTDRLDVEALLRMLIRFAGGERDVWRPVRVPSVEDEDTRRQSRERERLKDEEVQHRNRIRGLLVLHGIKLPIGRKFRKALEQVRLWDGGALPAGILSEILRELDRLDFLQAQLKQLGEEHRMRVMAAKKQPTPKAHVAKIDRLMELRGVGIVSATVLVNEMFGWRTFRNRRQVGSYAGLTGTPYDSGGTEHEQGISKAGNPRVRTTMTELAWGWLQWQSSSKLSKDFHAYAGNGSAKTKKRFRKVGIVALARKLLIALWHYVEHGILPEGAMRRA